ncbi:hypothetical protein Gotur_004045, partial [Gossypium turneri]
MQNNQFTLLQVKDWRHIFPLLIWLIFLLKCNALPSAYQRCKRSMREKLIKLTLGRSS